MFGKHSFEIWGKRGIFLFIKVGLKPWERCYQKHHFLQQNNQKKKSVHPTPSVRWLRSLIRYLLSGQLFQVLCTQEHKSKNPYQTSRFTSWCRLFIVLILDEKWKKSTNLLKTFTIFISTDDINDWLILSAPEKVSNCADFSKHLEIGSTIYWEKLFWQTTYSMKFIRLPPKNALCPLFCQSSDTHNDNLYHHFFSSKYGWKISSPLKIR